MTARWLYGLLNDGKPRRAIEGLLFAALYDIDVVVPSMRPVAAWMALWDDRIRDRIIAIAPEVLLEHGDPSSLPVDVRSRLLRTFAELNRGRSHIDASFDLAPIRRLADSQLATTVLELLEQHRANEELRQLLLGIIWQGQIADNVHEGAYSPDARDDAERTRGYLLGRVAHMPGREAFETLIAFSQELPDRWSRDRMLVLARRRAAEDTEKNAWAASDVSDFAREAEKDPRSARDLFDLACNRLDDLKLDLEEGDASEAPTVGRIDQEIELRNWFANRLRQAARGRYSVPPEEELADAKRPDLRIHAPAIDAPVALELKIADKWTYRELIERLRNQLVGQYLRDIRSRFGISSSSGAGRDKVGRAP